MAVQCEREVRNSHEEQEYGASERRPGRLQRISSFINTVLLCLLPFACWETVRNFRRLTENDVYINSHLHSVETSFASALSSVQDELANATSSIAQLKFMLDEMATRIGQARASATALADTVTTVICVVATCTTLVSSTQPATPESFATNIARRDPGLKHLLDGMLKGSKSKSSAASAWDFTKEAAVYTSQNVPQMRYVPTLGSATVTASSTISLPLPHTGVLPERGWMKQVINPGIMMADELSEQQAKLVLMICGFSILGILTGLALAILVIKMVRRWRKRVKKGVLPGFGNDGGAAEEALGSTVQRDVEIEEMVRWSRSLGHA